MSRRGGGVHGAAAAPAPWAPDEVDRFFEAFHKHGTEFEQVAVAVGGGRTAHECELLHRKQAAYLSIPQHLQSAQAFAAMVESTQKGEAAAAAAEQPSVGDEATGSGAGAAASRLKQEGAEEEEEDAEGGGSEGFEDEEEYADEEEEEGEQSLAAGRARRTPKRGASARSGRRTPVPGIKRGRAGGGDGGGMYEFYGEGMEGVTESARKRRATRKQLDFPAGHRRRQDADEAKGIDALLALAVAGEESLGGMADSEEEYEEEHVAAVAARSKKAKPRGTPQRRMRAAAMEEEEDEEEEPADAGAVDDDKEDEDFAPPARRTPYSTPAKAARLGRPGSAHATPRRSVGRGGGGGGAALAGASPPALGLRGFSPYMLGSLEGGGDMLADLGLHDLSYLTSPGFQPYAPGFVPSPQNPMPRMRRRKSAPERVAPSVSSPIRTLFTRRSSLAMAGSLMPTFGYTSAGGGGGEAGGGGTAGPGGEGGALEAGGAGAGGAPQTAAEVQLRHCLQQPRTQRWAAAEFCYSALDRPFFMFNPLASLLSAMGLPQDARLSRKEWAIIRSGLGKPRRLSLKFLKEERARLERWRAGCREQYQSGGAAAVADPKVADHLPRPLGVGQRVVARHPSTRQLHDGSILTVAHNCYRVQFDRQELGVELVRDTDVMPQDPAENLPPALLLGRPRLVLNGRAIIHGQPVRPPAPQRLATPGSGAVGTGGLPPAMAAAAAAAASTPLPAGAAALLGPGVKPEPAGPAGGAAVAGQQQQQQQQQQQARPADAKALAELVVGLDKKEALLLQLRAMNDEAATGLHTADAGGAANPAFVNAYASVVLQLKDANERVRDTLEELDSSGTSSGADAAEAAAVGAAAAGGGGGGARLQHQQLGASLAADAALQRQLQAQSPKALSAAALSEAQRIVAVCRLKLAEQAAAAVEAEEAAAAAGVAEGAEAPEAAAEDAGAERQGQQQQEREQQEAAADSPADQAGAAAAAAGSQAAIRAASPASAAAVAGAAGGLDWSTLEGQQLAELIQGCVHSLVLLQQGAVQGGGALPAQALSAALDAALAAAAPREEANRALFEEVRQAMAGLKLQIGAAAAS